jgi:hypothetical protein
MPSERAIAAHHEAGHAVVALATGAPNVRASIKPRGKRLGWVTHGPLPQQYAESVLLILLAGPFAHRRFAPRSNWLTSDFNIVLKLIRKGYSGTTENKQKFLNDVIDLAQKTVDYFWTDIKVAAKALLKHETLTGAEMLAAIREARRSSRRRLRVNDPPAFGSFKKSPESLKLDFAAA